MTEQSPKPAEIEAFIVKLNQWGQGLGAEEKALLQHLLESATGQLSDDDLGAVVGGAGRRPRLGGLSKASKANFLPRLKTVEAGEGMWAEWAQRQNGN